MADSVRDRNSEKYWGYQLREREREKYREKQRDWKREREAEMERRERQRHTETHRETETNAEMQKETERGWGETQRERQRERESESTEMWLLIVSNAVKHGHWLENPSRKDSRVQMVRSEAIMCIETPSVFLRILTPYSNIQGNLCGFLLALITAVPEMYS